MFLPEMAATIGLLAVLGTATAGISATNDYVIQLRCGTAAEDPKINPRARAVGCRGAGCQEQPIERAEASRPSK